MATTDARARLLRALSIMDDAITIARRRTGEAAAAAEAVDGIVEQQLLDIWNEMAEIRSAIDELKADLTEAPTGP